MIYASLVFFLNVRRPPSSPLFPYTTLFRSAGQRGGFGRRLRCRGRRDHVSVAERRAQILGTNEDFGERGRVRRLQSSLQLRPDRKSTRLNSSHTVISYAVFCLKKKKENKNRQSARDEGGLHIFSQGAPRAEDAGGYSGHAHTRCLPRRPSHAATNRGRDRINQQ